MQAQHMLSAVVRSDTLGLLRLLDDGGGVDSAGSDGCTLLAVACRMGHGAVATALLDRGASLDAVDGRGHTAAVHALCNGHVGIAELLVGRGANPWIASKGGYTAFGVAIGRRYTDFALRLLHETPLSSYTLPPAAESGQCATVALGGGVDEVGVDSHESVLQMALRTDDAVVVKALLASGASVNSVGPIPAAVGGRAAHPHPPAGGGTADPCRCPLLYMAAKLGGGGEGLWPLLGLLMDHGVDIDAVDTKGRTALMHAAGGGHYRLAIALLDHNADVHIVDADGRTALLYLVGPWMRHSGSKKERVALVARMLRHGANVNTPSRREGATPLIAAVMGGGDVAMISALLGHGADRSAKDKDNKTALMHAQSSKNRAAVTKCSSHELCDLLRSGAPYVGSGDKGKRQKR